MSNDALSRRITKVEKSLRDLWNLVRDTGQDDHKVIRERNDSNDKGRNIQKPAVLSSITTSHNDTNRSQKTGGNPWFWPSIRIAWQRIREWPWGKIKSVLESFGILFAIGYAVVTFFQWRDLRRNFETSERAWVKIGVTFPPAPAPMTNHASFVDSRIINFGKSTITFLYAEAVIEVVNNENRPSFGFHRPHSNTYQMPIFPGDSGDFPIVLFNDATKENRTFTPRELSDLTYGKSYLAVYGMIIYSDQFGAHWESFCSWHSYVEVGTSQAQSCVTYNRIGDGKPPDIYAAKY